MATRNSASAPDDSTPEEPVVVDAPIEEPAASPEPLYKEHALFLDEWAQTFRGGTQEAIGTFQYEARKNGWLADTPSGWAARFARWSR
jgi:hypothetical protein